MTAASTSLLRIPTLPVNRLLQYQRGTLASTGGYGGNGGSISSTTLLPNTNQLRNPCLRRGTGTIHMGGPYRRRAPNRWPGSMYSWPPVKRRRLYSVPLVLAV